ncbi:hypothetical protein JOF56_008216 [Kibdelosporangium banguiense]|uniref:Secreted protein n=1 Tax=Kibdelosporangium banguiense TaxID=1365924 RepID=A0ABS4TTV1_9PSEU|nr:hypothetical protein [Kibdelosporangium banguiense]MBP2327831.1 hypothetical protein [Kibdelosporangium banguiense]
MTHSRTTIKAATGIVAALVVVALVLLLVPTTKKSELPDDGQADLSADVQRFALGMSTESGYTQPTPAQRAAIGDGVRRVLDGRPREAEDVLAPVGYTIRRLADTATQRAFYEISDRAAVTRGWGRILVDIDPKVHLGIEIPHPKADLDSESLGTGLFRKVPGSVLVVAGAHRRSGEQADMAHTTDSVFQTVHELLIQRKLPVVQLHGYQNESAPDSDVVVSAGPELHSAYVDRIAQRLESAGLSVCRPWVTGCPGLEGTTNVQARFAVARGGDFVHVEVSRDIRDTPESRDRVVSALARQAVGQ